MVKAVSLAEPTPKGGPATRKRSVPQKATGMRETTSIVVRPYTITVYQRVAALRAAQGITEQTEAGIERAYSVSALIRESMEIRLAQLENELTKAGMKLPEQKPPE